LHDTPPGFVVGWAVVVSGSKNPDPGRPFLGR